VPGTSCPTGSRWATLSYRWGDKPAFLKLTSENLIRLQNTFQQRCCLLLFEMRQNCLEVSAYTTCGSIVCASCNQGRAERKVGCNTSPRCVKFTRTHNKITRAPLMGPPRHRAGQNSRSTQPSRGAYRPGQHLRSAEVCGVEDPGSASNLYLGYDTGRFRICLLADI
jgi:hypothetical protein